MSREMLPTERVALATWLLVQGQAITVRQLAKRLEITPRGARMMLEKMSGVLPLTVEEGDDGGLWQICGRNWVDEPWEVEVWQNGEEVAGGGRRGGW